jgi:SAM-dependent methyltransferase
MKSPLLKTLIALVLAATIIGLTMAAGIRRGLDRAVAVAADDHTAIAISLSDSVYHLNLGYLGLKQVADTIAEYWTRDSRGGEPNVKAPSAERLNAGVRAAASLGTQTPGFVSDGTLIVSQNDGKGAVDYVTISFLLFGTQVQSLFYLYFALVGLSAVIFILTFRDNIYALAVLLCTLAAYYIQLRLHLPAYFGMRNGSTLCLVAMWHFVFLVIAARRPTPWAVLGAVVQLGILILAWRLRWAAIWVFGFVILVALVTALRQLRLRQFGLLGRPRLHADYAMGVWRSTVESAVSLLAAAEATLRWPIVLLLAGLLASSLYDRVALHAVYFTDDVMPERGLWNAAYLGLAKYNPGVLDPRMTNAAKALGIGEELGWWAARDQMDRIRLVPWNGKLDFAEPAPGWKSEWGAIGIRAGLQDRMLRGGFTHAVKKHPFHVLAVYLVSKPLDIVSTLIKPFRRGITWLVLSLLVGVGIGALVARFGQDDAPGSRHMILLSGGAVLAATMPSLWAYPSPLAMGDSVLLLAAFVPITVAMSTATTLFRRRAAGEKRSELIGSGREAKEGMMRAVMAPLYRLAEHAKGYELAQRVSRPTTERFRALIRSRVNPSPSENLLDVGCGPGHYRSSFTCQYSGVDINPDYIRMASSRLDGRFMVMDGTRLAFENETFDHIVSIATLHHLTDEQVIQMVREARRVCKPSGRVHLLDAILPVTPNFALKRAIFRLDRGEYPRTHEHLCALIAKAGPISASEIKAGPLHDVIYVGVTPAHEQQQTFEFRPRTETNRLDV